MKKAKKLLFLLTFIVFYGAGAFAFFGAEKKDLDKELQDFSDASGFGNVYDYANNLTVSTEINSNEQSFTAISKQMSAQYSCSVDSTDVYNVYMNMSRGIITKQWTQNNTSKSGNDSASGDKFQKSCLKIAQCLSSKSYAEGSDDNQDNKKELKYSSDVYSTCRKVVEQNFLNIKPNVYDNNSQKNVNYGDDIFMNGKTEDSMFDLMKDVEYIGKVIFKSVTAVHKANFYNNSGSSKGSSSGPSILSNLSANQNLSNISDTTDSAIINSSTCKVLDMTGQDQDLVNSNATYSTDDASYNYEDLAAVNQPVSQINNVNSSTISSGLFSSGEAFQTFDQMFDIASAGSSSSSSSSSFSLGNGGPGCGGIGDANGILDIKFCMVDSKKGGHSVGNGSSSGGGSSDSSTPSIEEILDKILDTLNETKKLGASMKHTYADERWESMLKDIKLKDIFSFDFVVKVKPLFGGKGTEKTYKYNVSTDGVSSSNSSSPSGGSSSGGSSADKDKDSQEEKNARGEEKGAGLGSSMSSPSEYNKYVVLWTESKKQQDGLAVDSNTYDALLNTANEIKNAITPDNSGFDKAEQKKTGYETMDEFKSFIDGNDKFWLGMQEGLKYMSGAGKTMKEKIEDGAN